MRISSYCLLFLTVASIANAEELDSTLKVMHENIVSTEQRIKNLMIDAKTTMEALSIATQDAEAESDTMALLENARDFIETVKFHQALLFADLTLANCVWYLESLTQCKSPSACEGFRTNISYIGRCATLISSNKPTNSPLLSLRSKEATEDLATLAYSLDRIIQLNPEVASFLCGE